MSEKLIKINSEYYVIVDDSEIKEGDWVLETLNNVIFQVKVSGNDYKNSTFKKITHSTQPLNTKFNDWFDAQIITLQEVKELIGEVDVEKKAYRFRRDYQDSFEWMNECIMNDAMHRQEGYKAGYNQALEDNKEKKYTEEDLRKTVWEAIKIALNEDFSEKKYNEIIQSLQPKTEWEVEFENGVLKLK